MALFLRFGKSSKPTDSKVWLEDAGEAERPRWLEKPTVGYVQQVFFAADFHL